MLDAEAGRPDDDDAAANPVDGTSGDDRSMNLTLPPVRKAETCDVWKRSMVRRYLFKEHKPLFPAKSSIGLQFNISERALLLAK